MNSALPQFCHWEVVSMRSHYITEEGLYIQENLGVTGRSMWDFREVIQYGIDFPEDGPSDAVLWHVRGGEATVLVSRINDHFLDLRGVEDLYDNEEFRITKHSRLIKPGDGFVLLPPGLRCVGGPVDRLDGRLRPTVRNPLPQLAGLLHG